MAAGIPALHLDGKTPRHIRKQASIDFAMGKIEVLCNIDLFGEGYDLAAQAGMDVTIECVISARPTQSLSLWLQQCGRALRKKDYPAIILDHAGNAMRHGLPDDEREWSLDGKMAREARNSDAGIPIRQCPKCYAVHKPADVCPECGHVYEIKARSPEEIEGELVELSKEDLRRQRTQEQGGAQSLGDLIALGSKRGISNPEKWARKVHEARREKERLRLELINLYKVTGARFNLRDVRDMKPKQLREAIDEVKGRRVA